MTHRGFQGYTTLLPTIANIIRGQINNKDNICILAQPNSTDTDLKTSIGRYFSKERSSFYLTSEDIPLGLSELIHPGRCISINSRSIPRLFCPRQCHHTMKPGQPCPNQIPTGNGVGILTETVTEIVQDPTTRRKGGAREEDSVLQSV
jgi:hypothetical protein